MVVLERSQEGQTGGTSYHFRKQPRAGRGMKPDQIPLGTLCLIAFRELPKIPKIASYKQCQQHSSLPQSTALVPWGRLYKFPNFGPETFQQGLESGERATKISSNKKLRWDVGIITTQL